MFTLTANQKEKIRALHDDSFSEYCDTCGYEPKEHAELLLRMARTKMEHILEGVDLNSLPQNEFGSRLRSAVHRMRAAKDFFEFRNVEHEERRHDTCAAILRLASELPIEYEYVEGLSRDLGLASAPESDSVARLIEAVPIVSSWDFEFNAFVEGASLVDAVPCICVYETLLSTCDSVLHRVVPLALDFDGGVKPAEINICKERGENPEFVEELRGCISMAMGEANFVKCGAVETDKMTYATVHVMVAASVQFVWYHEFGHLLQGHLMQPESHQLEFDADAFAFQIMACEPRDQSVDIWSALGSLTPLLIIDILETISQSPESQSHPKAKCRINRALKTLSTRNKRVIGPAIGYLRSLAAVCNPTLIKYWEVSLDYGNASPEA